MEQKVSTTLVDEFRGRIHRAHYWAVLAVGFGMVVIACLLLSVSGEFNYEHERAKYALGFLALLFLLGAIVSFLSALIRRIRDIGWSSWWLLAYYAAVEALGRFAGLFLAKLGLVPVSVPTAYVIVAIAFHGGLLAAPIVVLGTVAGTKGSNRFGPDPLEKAT